MYTHVNHLNTVWILLSSNSHRKWILGITDDGRQVTREEAAIIFWAWRCLYAEVVGARKDGRFFLPAMG